MIYKPEHITDLDTGAIFATAVRCGDQGDTRDLTARVLAAGEVLAHVCDDPKQTKFLTSLTADEGYFAVGEVCGLQAEQVRVIIGDPNVTQPRPGKQNGIVREVLAKARRAVTSKSGKALLRKRGEHRERSFCHVLDHGKHRRATLRGRENLAKRQLAATLTHNLSLLMRHLTGHGTPNQWLAATGGSVGRGNRGVSTCSSPISPCRRHRCRILQAGRKFCFFFTGCKSPESGVNHPTIPAWQFLHGGLKSLHEWNSRQSILPCRAAMFFVSFFIIRFLQHKYYGAKDNRLHPHAQRQDPGAH